MGGQSHTANGWTTNGDHDWYECSVSFADEGTHYTIYEPGRVLPVAFSIGDDEAQARLIAAAPELLEALRQVMGWINGWDPNFVQDDEWPETAHHIRAAIAKSTGESAA